MPFCELEQSLPLMLTHRGKNPGRKEERSMTYEIPEVVEIGKAEDLVQLTEEKNAVEGGSIPDFRD
jgi:hypothetical protein